MIDNELKFLLDAYIAEHFTDEQSDDEVSDEAENFAPPVAFAFMPPQVIVAGFFDDLFAKRAGETFSEMLLRLIDESGEKPSTVYRRADIDRQIFSRIKQNKNYQPSKDTAISFAFALKLDLPNAKKLLNAAGYALTNSSKRDVIISFFLEQQDFDLKKLNETLYDYGQSVLLNR